MRSKITHRKSRLASALAFLLSPVVSTSWAEECVTPSAGQSPHPEACVVDPKLGVETVVAPGELNQPIGMAFLRPDAFFVIEKSTGKVRHVQLNTDGTHTISDVLDLPVNSSSERGLLSIALHPGFKRNGWVYLYWTESSTGNDSTVLAEVPELGNRVDRFVWDGKTLTQDINIIKLRSYQEDKGSLAGTAPNQTVSTATTLRGNHNGGKIAFDTAFRSDGKDDDDHDRGRDDEHSNRHRKANLYIVIGDNGRRGQMQNLRNGPPASMFSWTAAGGVDDGVQFGGPQPDDAHLTGVVLRVNDDGTPVESNPFYQAGRQLERKAAQKSPQQQSAENIKKIYAYGIRNCFGLAVDPYSGELWEAENGDSAYDEINRIDKGMNGGWIQLMGPAARVSDFKAIEIATAAIVNPGSPAEFANIQAALQQYRWPPTELAESKEAAIDRLFKLDRARYRDPQFSWRYVNPPAGLGFVAGKGLGADYVGDLLVGNAGGRQTVLGGFLYRFNLDKHRENLRFDDAALNDRVADNTALFDTKESESLVFGKNFGVVTDIKTGPDQAVYAVSISRPLVGNGPSAGPGLIYKIRPRMAK